jgi:hypothetical protein
MQDEVTVIVCAGDIALDGDPRRIGADGFRRIEGNELSRVREDEAVPGSGCVLPTANAVALQIGPSIEIGGGCAGVID